MGTRWIWGMWGEVVALYFDLNMGGMGAMPTALRGHANSSLCRRGKGWPVNREQPLPRKFVFNRTRPDPIDRAPAKTTPNRISVKIFDLGQIVPGSVRLR